MSDEAATNQQSRTVMSYPEAVAFNQGWNRGEAYGRKEALREAQDAVAEVFPYGAELNSDGSESPGMAAWVEGGHDAWAAIGALRSDTEVSS